MGFDRDAILKAITLAVDIRPEDLIEAAMVVVAKCDSEPSGYRSYVASTGDEQSAAELFAETALSISKGPGELVYDSRTEETS